MGSPRRLVWPALVLLGALGAVACQRIPPRALEPERTAAALAARSLEAPEFRVFLETALGKAVGEWPLAHYDLDTLTIAALYFQPDLDVARAHADVVRAAIATAGERPNPTLTLAPELSSNPGTAASPWLAAVHLDWPIETAGKRGHRVRQAEEAGAAARAAVLAEAWRVRRQLSTTLAALAGARCRAAALEAEVAAGSHLVDLLTTRVQRGAAAAVDVAPFRFTLSRSAADLAGAHAERRQLMAQLAAGVGVSEAALVRTSVEGPPSPPANPLMRLSRDQAVRQALLARPDVRAALADYAAREAALALELARQYPDLHLGSGYQFDQGQNKWSLGVSVDLPLLNQNQGPIAEADAARDEAAARFIATQAHALAEVEQAVARRAGAVEHYGAATATLADREANVRRVRSALRLGAADRIAELTAELERLSAARAACDAEAALQDALGDLEAAVQGPPVPLETLERARGDRADRGAS